MNLRDLSSGMTEAQTQKFLMFYKNKRKEVTTMLLLTIIGFFGVAGIQRFVIGEILLGILFLFTAGFCGIGTIIDLINIKRMTGDYNRKEAMESAAMAKMMSDL